MSDSGRRRFLAGRAALQALRDAAAAELPAGEEAGGGGFLMEFARRAMACEFVVYLNSGPQRGGAEAAMAALDVVESLEDQMTVFRDHSEISRINARAADGEVQVEPGLFELLCEAARLSQDTAGAFDITASPLWRLWGFHRKAGRVPGEEELSQALKLVGNARLMLDPDGRTIAFDRPGVEINLGGIGKGHALDRAAFTLLNSGVEDILIHGGKSSVLARGSHAARPPERRGWLVGIIHPLRPEQRIAEVLLADRALGTSGTATQSFFHQGRRYGHIIDPRTGRPADRVLSATAIAPTAALADALSTAFYVMGAEQALEFCRVRPELAAIIVSPGGRAGEVDVKTVGLSDEQWKPLDGGSAD